LCQCAAAKDGCFCSGSKQLCLNLPFGEFFLRWITPHSGHVAGVESECDENSRAFSLNLGYASANRKGYLYRHASLWEVSIARASGWERTAGNHESEPQPARAELCTDGNAPYIQTQKRPSPTGEPDLQKLDEQEAYATTSIPIGRAVSLMLFTAASTEPAVRRGIVQQLV
jgi:hypothetical protein